jgi:YVTN family beta-propeller protein
MKTSKIISTVLLALCVLATCGDSCWPVQQGSPGFPVDSDYIAIAPDGTVLGGGGVPGQAMSGIWLSDNSGATGSVYSFNVLTDQDGTAMVTNGRINANWSSQIIWEPPCGQVTSGSQIFTDVTAIGFGFTCILEIGVEGPNTSTHFVLPGATPSTITSYGDFSTTYGSPQLRVYIGAATPGFVSSVSASSEVPGSSATFPFPTQSNGSPLAEGFYALVNTNVASGGGLVFVDPSYLAVGGTTVLANAFGADAGDVTVSSWSCTPGTGGEKCLPGTTQSSSTTIPTPIFTQYYASQVSYNGHTYAVGSEPVAVREYGSSTVISPDLYYDRVTTTQPANAIVANMGSGNVSLLNLVGKTVLATVAVGSQPIAIAVNSAGSMAYVANYGSGTLSEINLSTYSVSRTATVGTGPMSVAMDPSGSYVWVGGTNYLDQVSLSSFAVVDSVPVSGTVTSLAASNAQNELVYTLVQNCCSASSTYAANELLLSNLSTPGTYAHAAATPYASYTMNGTLPSAAALPQATSVVSARFSNGMAASATPTGFVIYDVVSHQQLMTGNTPTPVRGIASDPDSMYAYFTLPDSNEYIVVPLESTP